MTWKFVHASDLHLDSPLHVSGLKGPLEELCRKATFSAFERVVDTCLAEGAEFLLLAGDLFETRDRSVRARLFLRDQLARLDAAGIAVFVVHGNHDPLAGETHTLRWPSNTHVFGANLSTQHIDRPNGVRCAIQGVSYPQERVTESLAKHFSKVDDRFTIGLLHCNVGGSATGHADYAPARYDELEATGIDYWALGHVHARSEHVLPTGSLVVYPGNTQGRHAGEAGPRGCVVVTVKGTTLERRFVPTDVVRWHRVAVSIEALQDWAALEEAMAEAALTALRGTQALGHLVSLALEGHGPLHAEITDAALDALRARLGERLAQHPSPGKVVSLTHDTAAPLDVEGLRREGGLAGTLIELGRRDALPAFAEESVGRLKRLFAQAGVSVPGDERAWLDAALRKSLREVVGREEP
ncbi:MAG: exonuclease SbcCD subunit D [Myxococcaceae bacterium]